jgi:hypothetical protein
MFRNACKVQWDGVLGWGDRVKLMLQEVMKAEEVDGVGAEPVIHRRHFEIALAAVHPSVSAKDRRAYDRLRNRLHQVWDSSAAAKAAISEEGVQGGDAAPRDAVECGYNSDLAERPSNAGSKHEDG